MVVRMVEWQEWAAQRVMNDTLFLMNTFSCVNQTAEITNSFLKVIENKHSSEAWYSPNTSEKKADAN